MLYAKFGKSIADKFLIPYNEKLYACDLDTLDPDAMGRFFPYADKEEIINNDNHNLSLNHYSKSEIKSDYEIVKLKDVLKKKPVYGSGASKTDYDKKVRYVRITDINEYGCLKPIRKKTHVWF